MFVRNYRLSVPTELSCRGTQNFKEIPPACCQDCKEQSSVFASCSYCVGERKAEGGRAMPSTSTQKRRRLWKPASVNHTNSTIEVANTGHAACPLELATTDIASGRRGPVNQCSNSFSSRCARLRFLCTTEVGMSSLAARKS